MDQTFMLSTSLDQIFLYLLLIYFIVFIVCVKLHYVFGESFVIHAEANYELKSDRNCCW